MTSTGTGTANANGGHSSPMLLTQTDLQKLKVVVQILAPKTVLEQQLNVPEWEGKTLMDVLAGGKGKVEIPVLRAAVNEASTSALLSSTMMVFDSASSSEASAKLLNEIDEFQKTVLGVLEELDGSEGRQGERGVKREGEDDGTTASQPAPPTKMKKYMLHRSLASGVDLFTSAAILSESDLAEFSAATDTDLISVLPPLPSSASASTGPSPSLLDSTPTLGSILPPPCSALLSASTVNTAPLVLYGLAPDQTQPNPPTEEERGETKMLYYGPYSTFAPSFDSTGSSSSSRPDSAGRRGGYSKSAEACLGRTRRARWTASALSTLESLQSARSTSTSPKEFEFEEDEKEVLRDLGIDVEVLRERVREEEGTWKRLGGVSRMVERVGVRQRARVEQEGSAEDGKPEVGEGEREDASLLLSHLSSLLASHSSQPTSEASTSSVASHIRLVPPPGVFRTLTPLYMAATARDPVYGGTGDEANHRAVREGVLTGAGGAVGEGGMSA
ncbi:hypothetical protein JCM11641_002710 [Rhodosporidiobolus odoratus]